MDMEFDAFRKESTGKAYAHFGTRCTLKDDWVWYNGPLVKTTF